MVLPNTHKKKKVLPHNKKNDTLEQGLLGALTYSNH